MGFHSLFAWVRRPPSKKAKATSDFWGLFFQKGQSNFGFLGPTQIFNLRGGLAQAVAGCPPFFQKGHSNFGFLGPFSKKAFRGLTLATTGAGRRRSRCPINGGIRGRRSHPLCK